MLLWKLARKARTALRLIGFSVICRQALRKKWQADSQVLPLTADHWDIYKRIHKLYWLCFCHFPNLISGETFNEKIQWLKLFGQDPRMVELTDKLALKRFVNRLLGPQFVPATLQTGRYVDELDLSALPPTAVLKANHDSGSVLFVLDANNFPRSEYKRRLDRAIRRTYGRIGGEWQYWPIERKVFVEELLPFSNGAPPPDYKFHCANGRVRWQQFIYDRGHGTKEVITDRDGSVMGVTFDDQMMSVFEFNKPDNWDALVATAETLASDFPYVRVDLYDIEVSCAERRILVGEMTFTPRNGAYQSEGNEVLGRLLPLDRTLIRPPVSQNYAVRQWRQWLKGFTVLRAAREVLRRVRLASKTAALRISLPIKLRTHQAQPHNMAQPVIVSLTSYPPRFPWLALTLRCLLCQSIKPDKLILWVAHADYDALPAEVLALQQHGLCIERVPDLKPYKKLIPALQQFGFDVNHVIADDDMYYPANWLESLLAEGDGQSVVCHFSREWRTAPDLDIPTYTEWPAMAPGARSRYGLLIGHGGVWFPPGSLGPEACDYELASQLCPLQDDIWFSWHALMRGFAIQRTAVSVPRFSWPGADDGGLALSARNNPPGGGNDVAVQKMVAHYGIPQ